MKQFGRDKDDNTNYQEVDSRKRNSRLCVLILAGWNEYTIREIKRIDAPPQTFGWEVSYVDASGGPKRAPIPAAM